MAGFLFALTLLIGGGSAINAHNAGKTDFYAENPKELVEAVGDSITDGFKEGEAITQEQYALRFND